MTHLEFLNKNLYRKYPFKKTALVNAGVDNGCFVALRVNQSYGLFTRFYFSKLSCVNGVFYGTLVGVDADDNRVVIGSFCDKITKDGQVLFLRHDASVFASGNLTVGLKSAFAENFYAELDEVSGEIEPTCVGYFVRPSVTSMQVHPCYNGSNAGLVTLTSKKLTGDVSIETSGLDLMVDDSTLYVTVTNPEQIQGKGNKSLCAGNCDDPVIYHINDVSPDITGDIKIEGVAPVEIITDSITGSIRITTPTIDRETLCQGSRPNQPPLVESNSYYTDILTALKTEWQTWSQYND